MRISDWSSDVCSSDLTGPTYKPGCMRMVTAWGAAALPSNCRMRLRLRRSGCADWLMSVRPEGSSITGALSTTANPCITRSEEHTSELQAIIRITYADCCLKKTKKTHTTRTTA